MNQIEDYKCPQCTAPLSFDPETGKVVCQNCGATYDISQLHYSESGGATVGDADSVSLGFDWGNFAEQFSHIAQGSDEMIVYNCENCGAVIECDANTVATKCPYCDSNIVISDRVKGGLKPNAILPFRITPKDLPDAVNRFYGDKKLLPKNFFDANELGKVQGIYVPFWLYSCTADGPVELSAENVLSYRDGNYDCVETRHYRLIRDGSMQFANIPCDASIKMDNDLMDSLEPFDFSDLQEFNGAYLTGYVAERFDSTPDQELSRASDRLMSSALDVIASTCAGFTNVRFTNNGMKITDADVKYVLLPVYLFNSSYDGKEYRYAMNGQTGKIIGDLPISKEKKSAYFWKTFAITFLIIFLLAFFMLR